MPPAESRLAPARSTQSLCSTGAAALLPSPVSSSEMARSAAGWCARQTLSPGCVTSTPAGSTKQISAVDVLRYPLASESGGPEPSISATSNGGFQALGDDAHAASIDNCLPPFINEELESQSDSLEPSFTTGLTVRIRRMTQTLPDNSLDSQARLLHFIIKYIRERGFTSTYWFKGKSLDQLRAALYLDPSFSTALRNLISGDIDEYCDALFHVLRYVCRRPPSYKSPKTVHFAETIEEIDSNLSQGGGGLDVYDIPPFVSDDLPPTPSPIPPSILTHLASHASQLIAKSGDDPDLEVRIVQGLLGVLLRKGLIPPNPLTNLDTAGLRDVLQRDPPLWHALRELTHCDVDTFVEHMTSLSHYFCGVTC